MRVLKSLSLAIVFLAISALTDLFADEWYDSSTGLTWNYTVDEGSAELTFVSPEPTGALSIPATLGGTPVTRIGCWTFSAHGGLTSVTIPATVTSIGDHAFVSCWGLKSVMLSDGVTRIGDWSFADCVGLRSVAIPPSVTSIGDHAFPAHHELTTVFVAAGDEIRVKGLLMKSKSFEPHEIRSLIFAMTSFQVSNGQIPPGASVVTPVAPSAVSGAVAVAKAAVLQGCILDASGAVVGSVELKVAKEGKKGSKVGGSATLFGGKKQALKCATPVVLSVGPADVSLDVAKSGTMNLCLGATADGTFAFAGSWVGYTVTSAAIGGEAAKSAVFRFTDAFPTALASGAVNGDFLPDGEPVAMAGRKWTCAKSATVKYAKDKATQQLGWIVNNGKNDPVKTNLSGLKLTYTAKTGAFKGSFSVYTLNGTKMKKVSAAVTGLVVDGTGYGTATVKGGSPIGIIIE